DGELIRLVLQRLADRLMHQGRQVLSVALSVREILAQVLVILKVENRRARRMAGVDLTASRLVLRRADVPARDVRKFKCGGSRTRGACHIGSPCPSIVLSCTEAAGLRRTDRRKKHNEFSGNTQYSIGILRCHPP